MSDVDKLQWNWNEMGKDDPLFAVLSEPKYRHGKWDKDEFYATGLPFLAELMGHVDRLCPDLKHGRALDFGCGVGRLTQALAGHFDEAVGIDIAESMVAAARQHNQHGERCSFVVNVKSDLSVFESASFDFVMTFLVLQHIPPELVCGYIQEFMRILRPGGVAYFHVPIASAGAPTEELTDAGTEIRMGMFATPIAGIEAAIKAGGGELVHSESGDHVPGAPGWVNLHAFVRK